MPLYVRILLATGPPGQVEEASRGHLEQVAQWRREGRLRTAGSFPRGDGFLEIFEAEDRLEADRLAFSSPLVELGLVSAVLRPWVESPGED
ncbi:hypothetical protein ABI59_21350 [Acidobacteria bacterium Mor1]|nr:hypothetical protein ABI59_21350 [Acidobacteria bacterium Mor1]